jgi:hypothetical protein
MITRIVYIRQAVPVGSLDVPSRSRSNDGLTLKKPWSTPRQTWISTGGRCSASLPVASSPLRDNYGSISNTWPKPHSKGARDCRRVLNRGKDFNPVDDASVRKLATLLRQKPAAYYAVRCSTLVKPARLRLRKSRSLPRPPRRWYPKETGRATHSSPPRSAP